MIYTLKRRVFVGLIATILTSTSGALAGHLLARLLILGQTQAALANGAQTLLLELDGFYLESTTALTAMEASRLPFCSEAQISSFRALLLRSDYLRDAGRMRDGRLACSAALGQQVPSTEFKPQFSLPGGARFYRNMTPYQVGNMPLVSIQIGQSFVVLGPYAQKSLATTSMHYAVMLVDQSTGRFTHMGHDPALNTGAVVSANAQARIGDLLYATRCSISAPTCAATYISIPEAMVANRQQTVVGLTLGGLAGAICGLLCSLLYRRTRNMEHQLRRAIRRDQLRMVYQPIVDLSSGRIVGAEALARWTDEEGFAVGPDVFVRLAEQRGFVGKITKLVLRQALRDLGETLRTRPDFRLSVNVTAADLTDPKFLSILDQALRRAEVAPQSLAIEITESCTARQEQAMETIRCLRERGHSVHIDDFGTGYSSLSYLHALSIDAIKIDRAFTQAIGTEAVTLSILPQILAIAKKLNLEVIVEGVETGEQAGYFSGGDKPILAQGWFFGRPVPAAQFDDLLIESEQKTAAPEFSI